MQNTDQQHQQDQYNAATGYKKVPIVGGFAAGTKNLIHWKKKVKAKFEYETSVTVHEPSNAKEEGLSFAGFVFDAMSNADGSSNE
ncbi:putative pyridoxal phosphate-dependent acyltransferase, partial [Orchesella cincta]